MSQVFSRSGRFDHCEMFKSSDPFVVDAKAKQAFAAL